MIQPQVPATSLLVFSLSLAVLPGSSNVPSQPKEPEKTFTSSIGMKFVWIPPGTFMMGSPKDEEKRADNEFQHEVTLTKGFYLGATTVTQEQWLAVIKENPSRFKGNTKRKKNLPVENVTWEECQEFLEKLGEKEQHAYRLPTEAEWEYACRAGSTRRYCYGDDPKLVGVYAWFADNAKERTHPVALKKPNRWGLYDMHGNIWQWCADWYGDYPKKAVVDPKGPEKGTSRVLRGGSFYSPALFVRCAVRGFFDPSKRGPNIGFRVVLANRQRQRTSNIP
jgi:formylglycine-generating enzyme required for sulfatase activity